MKELAVDAPQFWRFYLVHGALIVFAIGSVLALFVRSRKPAGGLDVVVWALLVPLSILLGNWLEVDAHIASFARGLTAFIAVVGVSGGILSYYRWVTKSTRPHAGIAFAMLAGFTMLTASMLPVTPARQAARRTRCKNNLKQIGLALWSFSEDKGGLPEPVTGEPPRSWRVDLLPYLDLAALRASYHDEATWDSERNLEPGRNGQTYVCPSMANPFDAMKRTLTCYAAVTGPNAAFSPENRVRFPKLPDGASTTVLAIEAGGRGITWTDPRDVDLETSPIKINARGSTATESPGIGSSPHIGGCHLVMADGAVRFISENIAPEVLQKLLTADGGESVTLDDF
ncbi:hypothetical protein AYO47_05515 [Planctomyces sp. SCGC AG-212-M04]|nr:hypothetical protein AYO47_05515 [Planctomyces sp. SCGC AG-212-M04]